MLMLCNECGQIASFAGDACAACGASSYDQQAPVQLEQKSTATISLRTVLMAGAPALIATAAIAFCIGRATTGRPMPPVVNVTKVSKANAPAADTEIGREYRQLFENNGKEARMDKLQKQLGGGQASVDR